MTQARKTVVSREETGVYHCVSRCVRRAFLCGRDVYTGKDYEHRREWVRERLKELGEHFGVEVFAYAVMSNHTHIVVRTRPDRVDSWSTDEVAERWCRLFRGKKALREGKAFDEGKYERMRKDAEQVLGCRGRLKDLSWFMRCLNESVARRANREDECTGRFWEGRFKCQRLMDEGAMLACMAYVDLNPVRAKMADTLEDSEFTSVYDRVVSRRARERVERLGPVEKPTQAQKREISREEVRKSQADWLLDFGSQGSPFFGVDEEYYLSLVEWTGRHLRRDKPGYLPVDLRKVLDRFDLDATAWAKNVETYGSLFYRIVGKAEQLLACAKSSGQRWFRGRSASETLYRSDRARVTARQKAA